MHPSKQIIIKFTSNYPSLFNNGHKFLKFINFHMGEETDNGFYMETMENGLLYIYDDLDAFKLLNSPYTIEELYSFKENHKLVINPELLWDGIVMDNTFPPEGITLQFQIICEDKNQVEIVKDILWKHFSSYMGKFIEKKENPEFDLVLNMKEMEAINRYALLVTEIYSGLLRDSKIK